MPVSDAFSAGSSPSGYPSSDFSTSDPDRTGNNTVALPTYIYTGGESNEPVSLPASGGRTSTNFTGVGASGQYVSASDLGSAVMFPGFSSNAWNRDATALKTNFAGVVRCVQE